jgi:hypothetical protein
LKIGDWRLGIGDWTAMRVERGKKKEEEGGKMAAVRSAGAGWSSRGGALLVYEEGAGRR